MTIFAVNRNPHESILLDGDLRGLNDYKFIEYILFEHQDPKAINSVENPLNVVPHRGADIIIDNGRLEMVIPRLSWNVIRLGKH